MTVIIMMKTSLQMINKMACNSMFAKCYSYFIYLDHETNSILAQLARIIMKCVGEKNVFSLWFKVVPEVGMAIRRNKLRISPVLHR